MPHTVTRFTPWPILLLTCLTMTAFAANSLLTRLAFQTTSIDPASFSALRIISGAATLWLIATTSRQRIKTSTTALLSALLLFTYVAAFSFAYRHLNTGTGALILFASAQLTMISYGMARGERTSILGLAMALGGLVLFLSPSATSPPLGATLLMALAGLAWGVYSLLGKQGSSPVAGTTLSFLWAIPLTCLLLLLQPHNLKLDSTGIVYALISGSLASGVGYALWYWVRVRMTTITASTVQLSVPVLSALLGALLLNETITLKATLSALILLTGIAWVTACTKR